MSTELEQVGTAIAEINKVETGLAELRKQYGGQVYEVTTTAGLDEAKKARAAVRQIRYNVETIRKEAKAPLLKIGRDLDSEAKRITGELLSIETPVDEQIKLEESRKEREREAKILAEQQRVEAIQKGIDAVRNLPVLASGSKSSADVQRVLDAALQTPVTEAEFAEFVDTAKAAMQTTVQALRGILAESIEREKEQERITAERAELARLRAEMAEHEAKKRAEREAVEAAARAKREAEEAAAKAARAEEERKQREALQAERKKQAEEQAKLDAQNKRLADERAAFERVQAEARRREQEAEARRKAEEEAARKRREEAAAAAKRAQYPGEAAIVDALCQHFGVPAEVVHVWLSELRAAA